MSPDTRCRRLLTHRSQPLRQLSDSSQNGREGPPRHQITREKSAIGAPKAAQKQPVSALLVQSQTDIRSKFVGLQPDIRPSNRCWLNFVYLQPGIFLPDVGL
jgi:hypothetical protein